MKKKIALTVLLFYYIDLFTQSDSLRSDSLPGHFVMPLFNTSASSGESEAEQQEISPLLQSSPDIYTQFSSFQFGAAGFRMRGYPSPLQQVHFNGVVINDPETGIAAWSSWGGLNDVMRNTEARFADLKNPYGNALPGGYININIRPSESRKLYKFSYANTSRIFRHRFLLTCFTGLLKNNWAFSFSASSRSGNEVMVPGTYFNSAALYFSAEKKLSQKHSFMFTFFMAPTEQGRKAAATLEAYALAGDNQYNSTWGLQNGKVRNASVNRSFRPTLLLNDRLILNKRSELLTSFLATYNRSGRTTLNWHDAGNPRPDYYKKMPSYFLSVGDTVTSEKIIREWSDDFQTGQINWDQLIRMNQANLYSDPHLLGQKINTTETRARYILENQVSQGTNLQLSLLYKWKDQNRDLQLGVNANKYESRKFKEAEDLLGADFWIDVDQFAEELGVEEYLQQNDLDNPNKKIKKGDRFGYDYSIHINRAEIWCNAEYRFRRTDIYFGAAGLLTDIARQGHVANGKFPVSSKGRTAPSDFLTANIKGGFTRKFSGRHYMTGNVFAGSNAPPVSVVFLSPSVRNHITPGLTTEKMSSADLNYHIRYSGFKARLSVYNTTVRDQMKVRTYWNDEYNTTVNLIMSATDVNYRGMELGAEKDFAGAHVIQCAFGYNQARYTNRPELQAWKDNSHTEIFSERRSYLKNYHLGTGPELAAGLGYKYNSGRMWFAGLYLNYFDEIYMEPNPDRRTAEATVKYLENEREIAEKITAQEKLPAYYLVNINAGKSIRIRRKYFLFLHLSVNNLLNNQAILANGYESLRWDPTDVERFQPKYNYLSGIRYMAIINFSF